MKIIKIALPFIIFIGCFGIVINTVFKLDASYLSYQTLNGISYYVFDFNKWMQNFSELSSLKPLDIKTILPSRTWVETIGGADWFTELVNNIALIFDWLYFPINVILYVLRWLCWLIQDILAVFGWPIQYLYTDEEGIRQYSSYLITALRWFEEKLVIPYL